MEMRDLIAVLGTHCFLAGFLYYRLINYDRWAGRVFFGTAFAWFVVVRGVYWDEIMFTSFLIGQAAAMVFMVIVLFQLISMFLGPMSIIESLTERFSPMDRQDLPEEFKSFGPEPPDEEEDE